MSPLLLHLAAYHTVPVILQHRSGQGAKRKRGWELGRTKKCFRSGGACHEGRWRHVGVVSRWAPSSLQFMPWAGDRGTEQGQVSSHFMECFIQINLFINLIPGISIFKCGNLSKNLNQTKEKPQTKPRQEAYCPLYRKCLKCYALSRVKESCLTLARSFLARLGRDWARCGASTLRDSSEEVKQASVKSWLLSLFPY